MAGWSFTKKRTSKGGEEKNQVRTRYKWLIGGGVGTFLLLIPGIGPLLGSLLGTTADNTIGAGTAMMQSPGAISSVSSSFSSLLVVLVVLVIMFMK